jgi:nucleoside phosphorylase
MEKNELDFSNDLADLIEAAKPTPDELGRLATRCGIERGSLEGKATEVRIELLVQSALRDAVLADRLYHALPKVFPHLNKQDLEQLYSCRPLSLRSHAGETSIMQESGSASRTEFHSSPTTVDVLLIVATDIEREAVLSAFEKSGHEYIRKPIGVGSCWVYPSDNTSVALVQCRMGSGGPGGSMLTAMEAITALTPEAVIMPGIAFGVDRQKQHIGDVLLSTQILNYELRRMGTDKAGQLVEITRGSRPDASPRLLDRFISARLARFGITVKEGLLLSGDKLVDNIDYREKLRSLAPEAIGGEMEGAGVYAAAHRTGKEWILVKAICDYADGRKKHNKAARQKLAADAAANAVLHVLEEGFGR